MNSSLCAGILREAVSKEVMKLRATMLSEREVGGACVCVRLVKLR